MAPRIVAVGYRARRRDARQGRSTRHRSDVALSLKRIFMIGNARMYALNDTVAAAWRRLFEWIAADAEVSLDVIAHPPPQPLSDLWRRRDLGWALMCGFPW